MDTKVEQFAVFTYRALLAIETGNTLSPNKLQPIAPEYFSIKEARRTVAPKGWRTYGSYFRGVHLPDEVNDGMAYHESNSWIQEA